MPYELYDCSLTNEGIYFAQNGIINKVNIEQSQFNIYCSPTIRTIHTIYPFAKKYNKKIKLEDSLYELSNENAGHYVKIKKK